MHSRVRRLEELCLEDNRITVLENLSHLKKLLKLDLGKNQISMVENLSSLEQLTQLSLEDNYISSLKGLESLTSLMELYLGNNRITTLKEINYIRALPKLLILDLSGNPVCKQKEYRSYIIYNLKKLKVLDGIGIDANEQQQAKEMFAGKLTEDLLNEILGHSYYEHIENLDLSNSGIRMMDVVTAERFSKLRVLVLDDNQISDVTSLGSLPLLRVLRLNKNRIASIPLDSDGGGGQGYLARCFPGLEVLELGNNRISSIAALNLKGMTDLRVLTLESNYIQRVDGLQGLPCLQQLVLAKNKIKRLDPRSFYGLNELRGLQLEENGLRSLAHCGPLPKVRSLFLAYNRLSEMSELEYLTPERGCGSVTEITLRNNPLARKQLYRSTLIRKIPSLKIIDGKEIKFEEREKSEALFTAADNNSHYQSNMYFYSNSNVSDPRHHTDKVPIKLQSFTLAGFSLDGPSVSQSPYAHSVHPNHNQHKLAYNGGGGNGKIGVYNSGPRHSHSKSMNHGHAHGRIVDQKNVNSMNGMHHGGMNMSSMNMSKQYRSGMMSRNGAGIAGIQSKNYGANGGGNSKYGNGRMNNFGGMVNKSRYTSTRL